LETARLLAQRGARLALWDRNADAVEAAADELGAVYFRACDVSLVDSLGRAVSTTVERLGALHGVVHCAGIMHTGIFGSLELHKHHEIVHVNLLGTINVTHFVLPELLKTGGSLVIAGSASAFYGAPEFNTYGATKAALLNLAQALRIEYADRGIHIGIVNPSFINTPLLQANQHSARLISSRSPLVKIGTPEAVAHAIIDGIEHRQFMIWVDLRSRIVFWLSRYASALAGSLMARSYRKA
ncbi:MAG: SDR family oxidoreductase, partial [Anaerolinea sp.]|nr:SDR family oxidoreductase [Anaerolinea sp.]